MRRGQHGETLIETLVSTALLGIVGIGIIGAIASVLISTDIDRKISASETVLRSYIAAIEDAPYAPCGAMGYASDYTAPHGYTPEITEATYWDGIGPKPVPATNGALSFGPCGGTDHGLQKISVRVTSAGSRSTTERATFVKRGPVPAP
ncbi:MAG: prepilin-type N-terminal cleavage/methylation domain-containing protein [Acidimicrobiia bacterium]